MITKESVRILTTKYQTSEINIRREYFQHLFLSYFYQQPKAAHILFKGGTALRLLYNSPRFSEDLDFNSDRIDCNGIEDLLLNTLSQIEKENISFSLKEAKQTSGGFLAIIEFKIFEQSIDIKIEISLRVGEKKYEIFSVISDFIPAYNLISVTQSRMVFEKIRALLERKKPRDFYDLYFLLRKQVPIPQKKVLIPEVLASLSVSKINFEAELKEFLPKSQWAIIRDFKKSLQREINKFVL